jgi:hypothetical protein
MPASGLRDHIEFSVSRRFPGSFTYKPLLTPEMVPTGIAEFDELIGSGIPRGCLTEIYGAASSGRTTLLISLLAQVTQRGEVAALVDVMDGFAPDFAAEAGVDLASLLWVRCGGAKKGGMETRIEQALKITDWLLQAGGFSVIALDLTAVPAWLAQRIPLTSWFRFRRAVENTATAFLLLASQSYAKTCASLVIRTSRAGVNWAAMQPSPPEKNAQQGSTTLLKEITFSAEVIRSRIKTAAELRPPRRAVSAFTAAPGWSIRSAS